MRFLFSCPPLEGHFAPMLPLAKALKDAKHEVVFATAGKWAERVGPEGFEVLPAGISAGLARKRRKQYEAEILATPRAQRRIVGFSRTFASVHAPPKVPDLLKACRSWEPDAIIHDSADLASPLVATVLGLPSVNHSFGALVPLEVLNAAGELVEPLWREQGQRPAPYAGVFRGLYIDLAPPTFASDQLPTESVGLRPYDRQPAEAPPWLGELGAPLVYVTLGTVFNEPALFRPLLDGLSALDAQVAAIVSIGRKGDPAALGPLPPRVRVEKFIAQAGILPYCEAVICHAGSGTIFGALAYGLPVLLTPQGANQFENADRAEQAGAGIVLLPEQVTPDAVHSALTRLLGEPAFRVAAQRLAVEIAAMPTASETAALVEAYVAAH